MQILLDARDVFKAAVMLEERGIRFYADAAAHFSGQSRNLLLQLSEMEKGHAQQFSNILKDLVAGGARAETNNEEGVDDFLQALTSDRIITQESQLSENDGFDIILEKAMLIEKNAVFFYTSVKEIMQGKMAADAIDRIIQEEVSHFKMLSEALNEWRRRHKRARSKTHE